VKTWSIPTGALLASHRNVSDAAFRFTPQDRIYFAIEATSPDGSVAARARSDGTIRLSDASTGNVRATIPSRHQGISSLAFSPDGTRIAAGYWDGTAVVWDVASGRPLRTIIANNGDVDALAFSPDGHDLATAGEDAEARLWDVRTGTDLLTLGGSALGLTDVAFSPDGRRLATGSADGNVRVYVLPVSQLMQIARERLTRGWRREECVRFLQRDRCPKP
jgi:WD40 repeat protein